VLVDLAIPQLVALLLRDSDLVLPAEQDFTPRPAGVGPMPKGGLRATIKRRGPAGRPERDDEGPDAPATPSQGG
jgi:hypothetical protein